MIGAVDPISDATLTASMIPVPTVSPIKLEEWKNDSEIVLSRIPQRKPKISPFKNPTHISLSTTFFMLSDWISPVANPLTIIVAPWIPIFPARPRTKGIKKITVAYSIKVSLK